MQTATELGFSQSVNHASPLKTPRFPFEEHERPRPLSSRTTGRLLILAAHRKRIGVELRTHDASLTASMHSFCIHPFAHDS